MKARTAGPMGRVVVAMVGLSVRVEAWGSVLPPGPRPEATGGGAPADATVAALSTERRTP